MPDNLELDEATISRALNTPQTQSNPFESTDIPYQPFSRYKGYTVDGSTPFQELEHQLSAQQSWGDRVANDFAVAYGNAESMFLSTMYSTKDLITGNFSLDGSDSPAIQRLYEERAQMEMDHVNFENKYDEDNPIMSVILPSFLTGSTKGWGEILKMGAYGIGAMGGILAQEAALTAATAELGGVGAIPGLAVAMGRMLRLPKTIAQAGRVFTETVASTEKMRMAYQGFKTSMASLDAMKGTLIGRNAVAYLGRGMAGAYGEAAFEALGTEEALEYNLLKEYEQKYGKKATGQARRDINNIVQDGGQIGFAANMGLLTLTGGFEFASVLKPLGRVDNFVKQGKNYGLKRLLGKSNKPIEFVDDTFEISSKAAIWNSKGGSFAKSTIQNIGTAGKRLANVDFALMEGVEEFGQLWIDASTQNFHIGRELDEVNTTVLNSVLAGLDESWSTEGALAVISGIMGGSMQGAMFKGIPKQIKNISGESIREKHAFLQQVAKLNDHIEEQEVNKIAEALNNKSIYGTFSDKVSNTKDQVYANLLEEVFNQNSIVENGSKNDKIKNLQTKTYSLFHQIQPFISTGLGQVYKDYMGAQIGEMYKDTNPSLGEKLKNSLNEQIDKGSKIYNTINDLFPNPYSYLKADGKTVDENYRLYGDYKKHLAGFRFMQENFEEVLSLIPAQEIKDSDLFMGNSQFLKRHKEELNQSKDSLKIFTQEGVQLDSSQRKSKKELEEKIKKQVELVEDIEKFDKDPSSENTTKIIDAIRPKETLNAAEYQKRLNQIEGLRVSLWGVSDSYQTLLKRKTYKEAIEHEKQKKKEAKKIGRKKAEIKKEEKVKKEEKEKTKKEEAKKSTDLVETPLENTPEKSATPIVAQEGDTEDKENNKDSEEITYNDIRSKLATGFMTLTKNSKGEVIIALDDKGKVIYNKDKQKIKFIDSILEKTLDDTSYEVVQIKGLDIEVKPLPAEHGLIPNSNPEYHYALVPSEQGETFEEIVSFKAKDAILVNTEIYNSLRKIKGLTISSGETLYSLAVKLNNLNTEKKLSDTQKKTIFNLINSKDHTSQISLDKFIAEVINYHNAVDELVKDKSVKEIMKSIPNYFTIEPHITDLDYRENREWYTANKIPAHLAVLNGEEFSKPILRKQEDNTFEILAENQEGEFENVTDKFKKEVLHFSPEGVIGSLFAVVPQFSHGGRMEYNTTPLLKTKLTQQEIKLIYDTFQKSGLSGIQKLVHEKIEIRVRNLGGQKFSIFTKKVEGKPNEFIIQVTDQSGLTQEQKDNKGEKTEATKGIPITEATVRLIEGRYEIDFKDGVMFYPRMDKSTPLNLYPSLISTIYSVKRPFKNYRLQLLSNSKTVEVKDSIVLPIEENKEKKITNILTNPDVGSGESLEFETILFPTNINGKVEEIEYNILDKKEVESFLGLVAKGKNLTDKDISVAVETLIKEKIIEAIPQIPLQSEASLIVKDNEGGYKEEHFTIINKEAYKSIMKSVEGTSYEVQANMVDTMLEAEIIKNIKKDSKPSLSDKNIVTLNLEEQIKEHLKNCHGLS